MGELTASIAHEVNQPLAAVVANANACLRWLAAETPDLDEARAAAQRIVRDGNRASDVIARIRGFLRKGEPVTVQLSVNDVVREIIMLTQGEVLRRDASLLTELADGLPAVSADRVQLQQLLLNLMMNALGCDERGDGPPARPSHSHKHLRIGGDSRRLPGFRRRAEPGQMERLFEAFYTTKPEGWAWDCPSAARSSKCTAGACGLRSTTSPGATFQFTLPIEQG